MLDAIVWTVSVAIHWCHVNDPNVRPIKIVHSIWLVRTNVVKIRVHVLQRHNVALIITWQRANVCQALLVMLIHDANAFKSKKNHNVPLMPIVQAKWPASIMYAKIHVLKRVHADRMPFVRWSIRCHCVQWCVHVSLALLVMLILDANQVTYFFVIQFLLIFANEFLT